MPCCEACLDAGIASAIEEEEAGRRRHLLHWRYFAVAAAMAAFLTACGGDGGKAPVASNPAPVVAAPEPAPGPAPATERPQVGTRAAPEKPAELAWTVAPSPSLAAAAHVAAKATPVRGSLHMSSTGNAPVTLGSVSLGDALMTNEFRVYGKPYVETYHYWNQAITVDYDGDGVNEYKLTVEEDSFLSEDYQGPFERATCNAVSAGAMGDCRARVGQPDRFMVLVDRIWRNAGLIDNSERDYDVTFGQWIDRDTGNVGVFWSGPSIDDPHPLDNPINGRARIGASGHAFLNDGTLVHASAGGELHLNLDASTVTLELGKKEQAHHRDGITLGRAIIRGDTDYFPEHHIPEIFTFREVYDPSRNGFGRDADKQLSRKNDVTSGNGSGQFAGVITKRASGVSEQNIRVELFPAVFGTVGLTDIQSLEGRLEGLSLLMLFQTWGFCASDARQSGCR